MPFNNVPDDGDPKPGPCFLGAEKRVKYLVQVFPAYAAPGIFNLHGIAVFASATLTAIVPPFPMD